MAGDGLEDFADHFENSPCGYLVLGPDGRIAQVNQTFCNWTGYTKHELLGKRLRDLLNMAGRMFYETHFAPLLRMQGFFDEVALDIVKADGKKLSTLANAREKRNDDGQLEFSRVAIFRATERRRYERDLVDARDTSEAANSELRRGLRTERQAAELRDQFIAELGHDLRNPLSSISAGINLLLRDDTDEKTARVLRLMLVSVSRMGGLIENVLDFARGRLGGGITLSREIAKPLQPTLEHIIAEIRTSFPDRKIEANFDLDGEISVDHARISQLFSNLMGNAITHGDAETPIRVIAKILDGSFEISVSNGGDPIPPAVLEGLFQPFYRGKVNASHQGLGLGLYIASQIARAHGGRIDVTSDDVQTRFVFRMPTTLPSDSPSSQ